MNQTMIHMGVKVVANPNMPADFLALVKGGTVVWIGRFDDLSDAPLLADEAHVSKADYETLREGLEPLAAFPVQ